MHHANTSGVSQPRRVGMMHKSTMSSLKGEMQHTADCSCCRDFGIIDGKFFLFDSVYLTVSIDLELFFMI